MDSSKSCECLSHDFITAKIEVSGLNCDSLKLFHSYLTKRKELKIVSAIGQWMNILTWFSQSFVPGYFLCIIFIHDCVMFIEKPGVFNFKDGNTFKSSPVTNLVYTCQFY